MNDSKKTAKRAGVDKVKVQRLNVFKNNASATDFGVANIACENFPNSEIDTMTKNSRKTKREKRPFGRLLTTLMAEKKMTLQEAADIADTTPSTVSGWRSGSAPEDFVGVQKLAHALGVSLSFLLTGVEDSPRRTTPSVEEVFEVGGEIFDGFAQISIKKLIPRKK